MVRVRGAHRRWLLSVYNIRKYIYVYMHTHDARRLARLHYHLAQKLFQTLHGPNQTFPNLPPEYERQGGDTYHPTRKYLLLCIYIYGPSIRKTPHAHIHHPVIRIAARHHRLPSSLSGRHPRRSHTLPPTDIDPPPPGSLRTLVRQKTLATAYYFHT